MQRQIVLDTETTGIRLEEGHRIIEIGCIEMINRKFTGNTFHHYINPLRDIESGALAVHGITNEFLRNKPEFKMIVDELMAFISGAEVIIHNAPFDVAFLNYELSLLNKLWKVFTHHCTVIDSLQMARKLHVGQRNSLDALCKRYGIDNSKRELHGALLDAHLLAQVYLAMTGGQGTFFDSINLNPLTETSVQGNEHLDRKFQLVIHYANEQEVAEHDAYLAKMNNCLWLEQ